MTLVPDDCQCLLSQIHLGDSLHMHVFSKVYGRKPSIDICHIGIIVQLQKSLYPYEQLS